MGGTLIPKTISPLSHQQLPSHLLTLSRGHQCQSGRDVQSLGTPASDSVPCIHAEES